MPCQGFCQLLPTMRRLHAQLRAQAPADTRPALPRPTAASLRLAVQEAVRLTRNACPQRLARYVSHLRVQRALRKPPPFTPLPTRRLNRRPPARRSLACSLI